MPRLDLPDRYLALLGELLARHTPGAEVWAYGSRVDGEAHAASDLDLVLRNPEDLARPQEKLFVLKEAIGDSAIPILVDVLDWARLPKGFHEEIRKGYVVIFP
uniref:Nucleotidyltransferase domain-containing protein n=1 Tax=Candidatus Kentrum sp. FM TaxID=2126340 RepID=A0A450SXG4_9GAMM|nr:MAG: Nucleotidyltransferase domain-containing protein [Candidatus Kentron sp. FM]VFJ59568.1 MAG: Nucleotidyltransferase domain-containing protein [Candidatus Kentron sp. FM]VFK14826.1 MAG: Nucleotidyltransferase domain-containing protein [Candidatus Kentron sp. FM]